MARPEPVPCSTMLPGSQTLRLTETNPIGPSALGSQVASRRLPALPRPSEPHNGSRFGPSLTPPSLGSTGHGRISDCSVNELAHSSQQYSKRDRPRPQSTGSLSGPLAGLASATLCTMGVNFGGNGLGVVRTRDNLGAGRLIPLKQGYLYKRSTRGLSKDSRKRKKKYVVITEDARLCYHPSKQFTPVTEALLLLFKILVLELRRPTAAMFFNFDLGDREALMG
ncbi:unnamed protein product [Echinostoma caproni]|uniref:PH domain-containing protein n=1 Tax=Echinostoma caproni TaxID=27848 RepID=A0A3P8GEF0_9TREM|nr:unnamed protein product [Echinostoma caproni]